MAPWHLALLGRLWGGGGRAWTLASNETCTSASVTYGTNATMVHTNYVLEVRVETDWAASLFLGLQFLIRVIVSSLSVASIWNIIAPPGFPPDSGATVHAVVVPLC